MNTRLGIMLLVVLALLLFVVACASVPVLSSQDDLKKVLDGKRVVPGGERVICEMENPNKLALGGATAFKVPCIIGADPREPNNVYVGTHDEKGYVTIIVVNGTGQTVLWRREGL